MPAISLPDGAVLTFSQPVTSLDVARAISPSLAKATLCSELDGKLVDATAMIRDDMSIRLITARDEQGLEVLRHSTAHLLAHAVKSLFPEAQVTIGPVIEDGFYYDFAYKRAFTEDDLSAITEKMQALVRENLTVVREELTRDEAIALFEGMGETYKVQIIQDIPEDETLTLYRQGDFVDLCRGPHVPSTGALGVFALTKVAGAYWRGDAANEMLTRIYGTAWPSKKDLKAYLHRIEEAKKRDHRKLGAQLGWFHFQEEAPGMVFWHEQGWTIYRLIQDYMRRQWVKQGYREINTPLIADRSLWEKSGHWDKFRDEMFITQSEERLFAVKPMNCPCHVQVFNQGLRSYRDLPVRLAEFGSCHRDEASGALHGLMRVRHFVQDDAHIFCVEDDIALEASRFIEFLYQVYQDFGFSDVIVGLSTRPEQRVGDERLWDKAEMALTEVLERSGLDWALKPGDGAFYGPKIDFTLRDSLGRTWQCGTLQLDFSMPARLDAQYVDANGHKKVPVMIHRAILGSIERFIGILIEHYAGVLPLWLTPVQLVVMNITDAQASYVQQLCSDLQNQGLRVRVDMRNEKIGYKIRQHTLQKVPYLAVVGDQELANQTVRLRQRDGTDLGEMDLKHLQEHLLQASKVGLAS